MIGKLTLLTLLAVAQSKPYDPSSRSLSAHHLCPKEEWHFLLPHEYDCTLFYYCEYGMRYDVPTKCAPGTEFSAELQVCIHPAQANCNLPGIPPVEEVDESGDNEHKLPEVVESEEQNFESEEVHVEPQPEPEDQKSESEENNSGPGEAKPESDEQEPDVEVKPHPVESEEHKPESQEEDLETEEDTSLSTESEEQTPEVEEEKPEVEEDKPGVEEEETAEEEDQKPEPPKDLLPNGCPADFQEHSLLPHETKCDKFYYCNFGEKVLTTCPPGTYFNYEIQVCDWPVNVNCANTDSGSEDNGSGDNENGSGDSENSSSDSENSSSDSENSSSDSENSSSDSENSSGDSENSSVENGNDSWLPNGCPDSDKHHLLPHETDCGKFYQCENGEKIQIECTGGLHFNPVLQVCDWPWNVNCENGNGSEDGDNNSGENNSDNGENNGNSEEDNNNNGENNGSGEENGFLPNGCPSDFNVNQLLPHESDCGKFYHCVHGEKVESQCVPGLYFNPLLQECDWPENVNCGNDDNNGHSEEKNNSNSEEDNNNKGSSEENNNNGESSESSEENNNNGENSESSEENNNNGENSGSSEENNNNGENKGSSEEHNNNNGENNASSEENNNNNGENNGNSEEDKEDGVDGEELQDNSKCANSCNTQPWAHAYACDKFWRCDGDKATLVVCSEGLFFNADSGTCDFMCNVDCVRNHVQTTANAQGLKIFVPWNKVDENIKKNYLHYLN